LTGNPHYAWVQYELLLPTSILAFVFGCITLHTKPKRLNTARKKAQRQATQILQTIHQHISFENSGKVVRVIEIMQQTSSIGLGEEDIYKLYDLVPACLLPLKFFEESPILDWHRYDLCIISAEQDLKLARRIESALRSHYPQLRIFVDGELTIDRQQKLFERVYYAGSRLCLALISVHLIHDPRRKVQLNYARQREDKISRNRLMNAGRSATYLKPIPLDEPGRAYMTAAKDLAPFVEHVSLIQDRDKLFRVVVNSLLEELRRASYDPMVVDHARDPVPQTDLPHRVFVSYSTQDEAFAWPLYQDLQVRGVPCWFSPEEMMVGQPIQDTIEEALRLHRKVLLIMSEDAIKSSWVQLEVQLAFEMERESGKALLFPIKIDNAINSANAGWALTLRRRHVGDFTDSGNPESYERALKRLIRALQSEKTLT
jgi:hypothetical protein